MTSLGRVTSCRMLTWEIHFSTVHTGVYLEHAIVMGANGTETLLYCFDAFLLVCDCPVWLQLLAQQRWQKPSPFGLVTWWKPLPFDQGAYSSCLFVYSV